MHEPNRSRTIRRSSKRLAYRPGSTMSAVKRNTIDKAIEIAVRDLAERRAALPPPPFVEIDMLTLGKHRKYFDSIHNRQLFPKSKVVLVTPELKNQQDKSIGCFFSPLFAKKGGLLVVDKSFSSMESGETCPTIDSDTSKKNHVHWADDLVIVREFEATPAEKMGNRVVRTVTNTARKFRRIISDKTIDELLDNSTWMANDLLTDGETPDVVGDAIFDYVRRILLEEVYGDKLVYDSSWLQQVPVTRKKLIHRSISEYASQGFKSTNVIELEPTVESTAPSSTEFFKFPTIQRMSAEWKKLNDLNK